MFTWVQSLADWLIYAVFGVDQGSRLGDALNFFVYDTIKILILLFLVTFVMGVVNAYFPVERLRSFLSRNKLYGAEYLLAAAFGAVTPFCSCSSVPLFIGFVRGGIPIGVTFAFLVTSPVVNEVAVAVLLGSFGLRTTAIYVATGITLGIISGAVADRLRLERYLTDWVKTISAASTPESDEFVGEKLTFAERVPGILNESLGIVKAVLPYILIGIGIGAAMHGYIPEGFFQAYIGKDAWFAVPLAVILGVPMYANASGIVPVIQVFVSKGIPIGTSLAFMMAVVGLSIPEALLLKKVMTAKLIGIFFGIVTVCIIASGYFFNWVL